MPTQVVHKNQPHDVYIGRPSKWGNPFIIGKDGTREECIAKYREWLSRPEQAYLRASIKPELQGKRLGCFCAPLPCHGDVLVEIADSDLAVPVQIPMFADQPANQYSYERKVRR